VNEDDVAALVRNVVGGAPAQPVDAAQKIAELIDLVLLEFKSITKEEDEQKRAEQAAISLSILPGGTRPPPPSADTPLGGLADQLEGPDSLEDRQQSEDASTVAGWLRGLLQR
jgi:serine/threonine-protein kinase